MLSVNKDNIQLSSDLDAINRRNSTETKDSSQVKIVEAPAKIALRSKQLDDGIKPNDIS